jgi:hypothetical protein
MYRVVVLFALAGCGRFGFDLLGDDQPPVDGSTDGTITDGTPTDGMPMSTTGLEDVATGSGDGGGVTIVSDPADHGANKLLVAAIHYVGAASLVLSVTDKAGNLYQPLDRVTHPQGGVVQLWFANGTLGNAANQITATFNLPATKRRIIVHEYPRIASMSGQATGSGNSSSPTTPNVGTDANSLVVMSVFTPAATVAFTSAGNYELKQNVLDDSQTADQILSAAGNVRGAMTLSPAANFVMAIGVFRR